MADIKDFQRERDRRDLVNIAKGTKGVKPLKTNLDLCGVSAHFAGHVLGDKDAAKDRLSVLIYGVPGASTRAIGAFRIEREQWQRFKEYVDGLFDEHANFASRQSEAD